MEATLAIALADLPLTEAKLKLIDQFERHAIETAMDACEGNISAAARLSGTERRQLGKLLVKHAIGRKTFRTRQ